MQRLAVSRSLTNGPQESAVSMKFTPSSAARRSTRTAPSGPFGSPPHSGARQLHRTVAEPIDGQVAAKAVDPGGVGGACGFLRHGLYSLIE
jgi:hypothetical protein